MRVLTNFHPDMEPVYLRAIEESGESGNLTVLHRPGLREEFRVPLEHYQPIRTDYCLAVRDEASKRNFSAFYRVLRRVQMPATTDL